MRRRLLQAAQIVVPVVILGWLAYRFGLDGFRQAVAVISPAPLAAALLLGVVAVGAHATRWRVVSRGAGLPLGRAEALAEYYRASALNTVLPGGVAGDVLRAWRQRTDAPRGWRPSAASVLGERAAGFCVLFGAASVVLLTQAPPLSYAVVAAALAGVAWFVARPALRRLNRRDRLAVWAWSALALAALLGLTLVVAASIGVAEGPEVVVLGFALLAGTAIPLNIGGWGPREAAGVVAAVMVGLSPTEGIALAAGYGLLATVSVLPGFLVLGIRQPSRVRGRRTRQVELDAHVVPEQEAP